MFNNEPSLVVMIVKNQQDRTSNNPFNFNQFWVLKAPYVNLKSVSYIMKHL